MKTIEVPNDILIAKVKEILDRGATATFRVKGYSMRIFLEHERDLVTLKAPIKENLRVGDVVLAEDSPRHYVLHRVIDKYYNGDYETAYLELAKHYAEGSKKYADRNMEKGLPWHSCVDSALRHYTKLRRGDDDEPHLAAVLWNLLTLLFMVDNRPEMNDLPIENKEN